MKKACSVCRTNCLRLHGPEDEEDEEDATAYRVCAFGKIKENEHVEGDRNPSFLKKLTESTMRTLKLPLSFVSDQKERLGDSVFLEGPSREKWSVKLDGSLQSLNLSFGQGWEKFVSDHVLQVNDQLTFLLSEQSIFQVEVYDGSGCQKRSALDATNTSSNVQITDLRSHDVSPVIRQKEHRKCGNATQPLEQHCTELRKSGPGSRVRRGNHAEAPVNDVEVTENDVEVIENDMEVAEYGPEVVGNGLKVAENEMEAVVNEVEMPGNRKEDEAARPEYSEHPESGGGLTKVAEVENGGLLPEQKIVRGKVVSKRRSVTESETVRALEAARALRLSNPNTLMVLKNSHVYKIFWLGFPKQFREWMPSNAQKVTLVNKGGHSWTANWVYPQGGLSGGWRRFSIDHRLEDHDVCVFELIDKINCVLLVHIFRVLGCDGEDPGLYTPGATPSKSPEENNKKRKSFQVSNGREALGTPGKALDRKNTRTRLSLGYQDVPIDKLTSGPVSAKKSLERTSGLLIDDKATASPAKPTGLSSSLHQQKLMGIGTVRSMKELVDQASLQERVSNDAGGQAANADDLGEKDIIASRARVAESNPSASQQALVVFRPASENMLAQSRLLIPNGSGSSLCPASTDELLKQVANRVEISAPTEQCAPTASPSTRKRSVAKQMFKVAHIYRGRHVGSGTEFLTELEGYSDGKSVATLARDDDTGFWWVPSDLFGWDMLHCYIE